MPDGSKLADLTEQEFRSLLDSYFAPVQLRRQLSHGEALEIAKSLNDKINIPIVRETKEEKILLKIVLKVDRFLYDNLPNEFYDLVRCMDKGIDDKEAKRLVTRLSRKANKKIDIPYIPELAEYIAIRFVIAIIIKAARKNLKLDSMGDLLNNFPIPDKVDAGMDKILDFVVSD